MLNSRTKDKPLTTIIKSSSSIANIMMYQFLSCLVLSSLVLLMAMASPSSQASFDSSPSQQYSWFSQQNQTICNLTGTLNCTSTSALTPFQLCPEGTETIYADDSVQYDCDPFNEILTLSADSVYIDGGTYSALFINASVIQINSIDVQYNLTINYRPNIGVDFETIQLTQVITIGNYLILDVENQQFQDWPLQNSTVVTLNSANITARRVIIQSKGKFNMTNQSSITVTSSLCLYQPIQVGQYSEHVWSGKFISTKEIQRIQFTFALSSVGDVQIEQNSIIDAATIFMVSMMNMDLQTGALVNSSARACRKNMGEGRGLIIQVNEKGRSNKKSGMSRANGTGPLTQAPKLNCTKGAAGAGYGVISADQYNKCSGLMQYFMFLTHAFSYIAKGPKLWTGSGGYGYNSNQDSQIGSGGGIIFILVKGTLLMQNITLQASGGDVYQESPMSAGSGGTVFIYSDILSGERTNITVSGGDSYNSKGAGSGGLVKISFQKQNKIGIIWINVDQGFNAGGQKMLLDSNGIFYGPVCGPGTVRYYLGCEGCGVGTYNTIGSEYCVKCPTSIYFKWIKETRFASLEGPILSSSPSAQEISRLSVPISQITAPWLCFQNVETNKFYYTWLIPGSLSFLSIGLYIGLLILFLPIGMWLRRYIRKRKLNSHNNNSIKQLNFDQLHNDFKQSKIITESFKTDKTIRPYELMYHIHRITVSGSNTDLCPWVLPVAPPQVVRKYVLPHAFETFAKRFNKIARWSPLQILLTKLLYILYPLHWFYYDLVKKRKYRTLCALLDESREYNLINNYQFQDKDLITLKFSKNKDYTSCYIDFFFYEKADLSYYNLSAPFIIYLSGEGNFIRPFYLQENDPFLNALAFIVNRDLYSGSSVNTEVQKSSNQQGSSNENNQQFSSTSIAAQNNNNIYTTPAKKIIGAQFNSSDNNFNLMTSPFHLLSAATESNNYSNSHQHYQQYDRQGLFKNLVNLNSRSKNLRLLQKFIYNFNAISCTLDLSAPVKQFIKSLSNLIEFIDYWNKMFFNTVTVQIDLILMISDLQQQNIVSSSIHILSNKQVYISQVFRNNDDFLKKLKVIIPRMNLNSQIDLKIGLFIYNPQQQIQKQGAGDKANGGTAGDGINNNDNNINKNGNNVDNAGDRRDNTNSDDYGDENIFFNRKSILGALNKKNSYNIFNNNNNLNNSITSSINVNGTNNYGTSSVIAEESIMNSGGNKQNNLFNSKNSLFKTNTIISSSGTKQLKANNNKAILSQSFGQSEEDDDEDEDDDEYSYNDYHRGAMFNNSKGISDPLLIEQQAQQQQDSKSANDKNKKKKKKSKSKSSSQQSSSSFFSCCTLSQLARLISILRYYMFSHHRTKLDRYTIKAIQTFLILNQTLIVFIWSIRIEIPFMFVNLIAPFVGIIWMISDNYSWGKLFLILNGMNLINQSVTLIVYASVMGVVHHGETIIIKIVMCQIINIALVLLNMLVGRSSITISKRNNCVLADKMDG